MSKSENNEDNDPIIIYFEKRFSKIENRLARLEGEMKVILIVVSTVLGGIIALLFKA